MRHTPALPRPVPRGGSCGRHARRSSAQHPHRRTRLHSQGLPPAQKLHVCPLAAALLAASARAAAGAHDSRALCARHLVLPAPPRRPGARSQSEVRARVGGAAEGAAARGGTARGEACARRAASADGLQPPHAQRAARRAHDADGLARGLRADLFGVRQELERIQHRIEGDSDGERASSVEADAASLDWESFAEYMHDQGYDSEEAARIYDDAEDSGSNGEADAADTANGAEPEDDAERREESSDTDSGDGGR